MTANRGGPDDERLFKTRWVHVFEEDTDEGAVYRPEDGDIPLSRRPRAQLVLGANGRATLYGAGEDDRLVGKPVTWREGSAPAGTARGAATTGADVEVLDRSPDRLVVQIK